MGKKGLMASRKGWGGGEEDRKEFPRRKEQRLRDRRGGNIDAGRAGKKHDRGLRSKNF